jgi:tetratricopeptide (TPR) repeat protein
MIEVTCGACGERQQLADPDIAAGRPVSCTSCKSRIAIPAGARAALPDLPAPRRPSPLAGAGPARPAPGSPLAIADLPAPKAPPKIPDIPRITRSNLPDLPAPKSAGPPSIPDLPAPKSPTTTIQDLPAPKLDAPAAAATATSTAASARIADATDLPAPKRQPPPMFSGTTPAVDAQPDLVAPKRNPVSGRPLAPAAPAPPATRPPPKPATVGGAADIDLDDLLAPTHRPGQPIDLPSPPKTADAELVAPKRPSGGGDLPSLKPQPRDIADLPAPVAGSQGSTDLPAPKGFFDDLPQPARNQGSTDLPAPKGFFDDLPQPARNQPQPELPAPKGFFDDIPQPARNQSGLPQPVANSISQQLQPVTGNRAHTPSTPPPTADDLFDDLTPPPTMQTPPALDLDELDLGPPGVDGGGPAMAGAPRARTPSASGSLRAHRSTMPSTPPPPSGTRASGDTDAEAVPLLDLGDTPPPASPRDFGKLDLPNLPADPGASSSGVSFKATGKGGKPVPALSQEPMALSAGAADLALDVEETKVPAARRKRRTSMKPPKAAADKAAAPGSKKKLLVGVLVLAVLGGGGYFGWKWWKQHQAEAATAAEVKAKLQSARAAMVAGDPGHWRRALADASVAFGGNSKDADAAGIAAQAAFASLFDDPAAGGDQREKQGVGIVNKALGNGLSGPEMDKAQALKHVIDGQPQRALEKLDPIVKRAPNDANAALYQGWARLELGDAAGAIEAFDRSAKALPKRDQPALYGRARAKLVLGDRAGAREDFTTVLTRDKTHVGAQVGLAESAMTPAEVTQREKDLIALLDTKDIDKADARIVAHAYTIIGDDARRGSRLDTARDRYRKALAKAPVEAEPLRGQAELDLREGKLAEARAGIDKALKLAPNDLDVNLVAAEVALREGKPADAEPRLTAVRDRKPVNPWQKARLAVLTGDAHLANKRIDDALAAYQDAVAAAHTSDVDTPLAIAARLGALADADPARAADLRGRATTLLAPIEEKAGGTASIAIALGVGYLAAGNTDKAETWLRKAVANAKDSDAIDARFQLAEALFRARKTDEALSTMRAAYDKDDNRLDVGLQLALRYEDAGRTDDAAKMYEKMLPKPTVTLDLRGRAGRFYARQGQADKAKAQGDEILKLDPQHPTGMFLRGVGFMAEGKLEEARRALQAATDGDKAPQFLDVFGRVNEELGRKTGDPRYKDDALKAYASASEGDPTMLSPLAGQGRLLLEKRQADKALEVLLAANKLAPANPDIQYSIGIAHQLQGKNTEAVAWMNKSLPVKPRPDGYFNVGSIHYQAGEYAPAATALAKATELGVQQEKKSGDQLAWMTDAFYMLGAAHADLGNDASAKKAWQAYIDRDPKDQVKVDKVKRAMLGLRGSDGGGGSRRRRNR